DLAGRYRTQMDIYRRSAMQALGKDVTVYLYFFDYERLKLKTEEGSIKFILAVALFPVLLMNGMYYMMPFDAINVYEYLSGDELSSYHLINIFTGSAVMPLVALITGYMLDCWRGRGVSDLVKI